ncbi:type II secretion system protein [Cohnella lupini]|uniref:Type IV pilus assembly protein PilA n=1 Tax=Cohnella lupini TaxID=1294267 RepID=A0A3D9IIU2_9BACL|nr:type II secretion system protein [Cohnella lupini]RED61703.1 type IV pilus assembly protein PilA [Cohnella lupini]
MKTAILRRLGKEEKGFTLIELLAVIVILGIIAAIAVPLIGNIINKSKEDSDISMARQIYDASRIYVTSELNGDFKNGDSTSNLSIPIITTLQTKGYLDTNVILPSSKDPIVSGNVVFRKSDGALLYVSYVTGTAAPSYFYGSEVLAGKGKAVAGEPTSPNRPSGS